MSISSILQPPLNDSQIRELIRQAKLGDAYAREQVILAYLPLAESYAAKYQGFGVPFEDLYQEACYGLIVALSHYDPQRKEVFATLASHHIMKYIRDALAKQNNSLPSCYNEDFYYELKAYIAAIENFKNQHGREPTDAEASQYLNISQLRLRRLKLASLAFLTPSSEYDYDNYSGDHAFRPVEEEVLRQESCLDMENVQMVLAPREREVLERRCGFTETREPQTWPQMSAEMGLSIEWLRHIYQTAVIKVRNALGEDPDLL